MGSRRRAPPPVQARWSAAGAGCRGRSLPGRRTGHRDRRLPAARRRCLSGRQGNRAALRRVPTEKAGNTNRRRPSTSVNRQRPAAGNTNLNPYFAPSRDPRAAIRRSPLRAIKSGCRGGRPNSISSTIGCHSVLGSMRSCPEDSTACGPFALAAGDSTRPAIRRRPKLRLMHPLHPRPPGGSRRRLGDERHPATIDSRPCPSES